MSSTARIVIGLLLAVAGVVWTLQGLDVLGGSGMSGEPIWAIIGPVVAIIGAVIAAAGFRSRR